MLIQGNISSWSILWNLINQKETAKKVINLECISFVQQNKLNKAHQVEENLKTQQPKLVDLK